MIETDWHETSTGSRCNILSKYVLEVWKVEDGFYAGVNDKIIKSDGESKPFETIEEAQAAAEELAQKMMHRDGLTDSDGN